MLFLSRKPREKQAPMRRNRYYEQNVDYQHEEKQFGGDIMYTVGPIQGNRQNKVRDLDCTRYQNNNAQNGKN